MKEKWGEEKNKGFQEFGIPRVKGWDRNEDLKE